MLDDRTPPLIVVCCAVLCCAVLRKFYSDFQHCVCASLAACCWCRVSCCLFLMSKMFYLLKYNQSRIAQARDKQVEENQDQSMKGCNVNSER